MHPFYLPHALRALSIESAGIVAGFPSRSASHRAPLAAAVGLALAGGASLAYAAPPAPGAALGDNFPVQDGSDKLFVPVVAHDAVGDFVVVWENDDAADGSGIFARLYHADGTAAGAAFQVNTTHTSGNQKSPAVAMDADGDFVVAWQGDSGAVDGDGSGIAARYFDETGAPSGGAIQVNKTNTAGDQVASVVAMDAAGNFVVAWRDKNAADGDDGDIFERSYTADRAARGSSDVQVNTNTTGRQAAPAVAMDASGNFVVTWEDRGPLTGTPPTTGSNWNIIAQRFNADGTLHGPARQVNKHTSGQQTRSSVAMDAEGDFVVAWMSFDGKNIFARRVDGATGIPIGDTDITVDTNTSGGQTSPAVAMDVAGDFVVAWEDDSGFDIRARHYKADGSPSGSAFLVNTPTSGGQIDPAVAMDAAGGYTIVWASYLSGDDDYSIVGQRYARGTPLDLKATLAAAPADTVKPGGSLTLTADISNLEGPSDFTGNAAIKNALTAATGLTADVTLPSGVKFDKSSGENWTCPAAPVNHVLTCTYGVPVLAADQTVDLVIQLAAPDTDGAKLDFSNAVVGDQPDAKTDNNTATAQVTVQKPPPDDSGSGSSSGGSSNGGGSSGGGSSSGGGGGSFGWLGLGLLGLASLRSRYKN